MTRHHDSISTVNHTFSISRIQLIDIKVLRYVIIDIDQIYFDDKDHLRGERNLKKKKYVFEISVRIGEYGFKNESMSQGTFPN